MAAAAILDFQNFKFLTAGTVMGSNCTSVPNFVKIGWTAAEIWRFFEFFHDGGRPPSWICNACVGTTLEGHLVVFITVQNLVEIDAVVLIICTFFDFASLAWKRLFTPQNSFFRGKIGEGVRRYWPPTNSFLLLGVYTSVSYLVKSTKKCDRESVHRRTHTHTHARTDRRKTILLSVPCYML